MTKVYLVTAFLCFTTAAVGGQHPVLSLVIDDIGYSLDQGQAAIKLEGDHTFAIIPGASNSRKPAAFAHQPGKEIILHLPSQSSIPTAPSEPNALHDSMDENQLTRNMVSRKRHTWENYLAHLH
ncbi:MAG: divergent polysaccharide deacetylase family protein [Proteobacteria bacterium]|nr:divergent polysaccharide deacetylase family protein [Pseudomonadota bacterium]